MHIEFPTVLLSRIVELLVGAYLLGMWSTCLRQTSIVKLFKALVGNSSSASAVLKFSLQASMISSFSVVDGFISASTAKAEVANSVAAKSDLIKTNIIICYVVKIS